MPELMNGNVVCYSQKKYICRSLKIFEIIYGSSQVYI